MEIIEGAKYAQAQNMRIDPIQHHPLPPPWILQRLGSPSPNSAACMHNVGFPSSCSSSCSSQNASGGVEVMSNATVQGSVFCP